MLGSDCDTGIMGTLGCRGLLSCKLSLLRVRSVSYAEGYRYSMILVSRDSRNAAWQGAM